MKRTLRSLGLLIITVLLTFGLAQQQQTGQQNQQGQQQQTDQQNQGTQQQGQQDQQNQTNQNQQNNQGQQNQQQGTQGQQNQQDQQNQQGQQQGQQGTPDQQDQQNRQQILRDAVQQLESLRGDIEAGNNAEQSAEQIGQIIVTLNQLAATSQFVQESNEALAALELLQQQVRDQRAEAANALNQAFERLNTLVAQEQTQQQQNQGQQNQQQGTQGQQNQQGQQSQEQQGTQRQQSQQFGQDQQLTDMLMELRQIQAQLGQMINDLERQLGFPTTGGFEDRVGALERSARAGALREARRDLRSLRTDIEAGERGEESAREIGRIRADLRHAFAGATGEDQQRANELEQQLGTLEEQVRTGATEAGTTFQDVLSRFDEELDRNQQQFDRQDRQRAIQTAVDRLEGLRADIEGGRYHEGVVGELGQIRSDFERSFQGTEGEEQQALQDLFNQFQTLEEQVRSGDEQARQTFEDVMQRFGRDFNNGTEQNQGQGNTGQGN